jgi:hypothetical protein
MFMKIKSSDLITSLLKIERGVPSTSDLGTKDERICWKWKNKLHRDFGPAVEYKNGNQIWLQSGLIHRKDGPAVIKDGKEYYYFKGKHLTKSEWLILQLV